MSKITDWKPYAPYFWKKDFDCKATGENNMQKEFLDVLLEIRKAYGKPMLVTSGFRSARHPMEAKKGHANGEHVQGLCCDIACRDSRERFELIKIALDLGISRIGIAKTFIHIGLGNKALPANVIWEYS